MATITLDNRARTFDPAFNSAIRPLNRWWIREQFTGETQDIFKGYAESYDQQWPGTFDAQAVVSCVDEFKVLALDALSVTNPPRDSYADVVAFDNPACYWRLGDEAGTGRQRAVTGPELELVNHTLGVTVNGAIVGDADDGIRLQSTSYLRSPDTDDGFPEDVGGTAWGTIETWFKKSVNPVATTDVYNCPFSTGGNPSFRFQLTSAGVIQASARNASATTTTVSSAALSNDQWYHLVATADYTNLTLYVNGVQVAQAAHTDLFDPVLDTGTFFYLGSSAASGIWMYFDEAALYHSVLSAGRIAAHYTAGAKRGFPEQRSGLRVSSILDEIDSQAPRSIVPGPGVRDIAPLYMKGQSPLDAIRHALAGEAVDALFFVARDGTLTFLDASHRTGTRYETVQATFDDDGTDLPYLDLDLDYSEAFLANEWNVTREEGTTQTASDAASIARYFKRSKSLTSLPVRLDSDATNIAAALLAKYKDPFQRILSLQLTTDVAAVTEALFRLDLGDRIRIFRTPPGGGARLDQTLWIQKISVEGANDGKPWRITLGVSPL